MYESNVDAWAEMAVLLVTLIAGFVLPSLFWIAVIDTVRLWGSRH